MPTKLQPVEACRPHDVSNWETLRWFVQELNTDIKHHKGEDNKISMQVSVKGHTDAHQLRVQAATRQGA